jgi:hypothetical protein
VKRSSAVTLGLVPAIASWFIACRPSTPAYQQLCTDQQQRVVDDQRCEEERRASHPYGYVPLYRYYYAPYRAVGYAMGEIMHAGSYARPVSGSVGLGRVVRGGFGSTAHGIGAGE